MEAYIERVSRANRFEYGKVRVAGCVGWALCASITGVLFGIDPNITFWIASGFALVLGLLLWLSRPESSNSAQVIEALGANRQRPFRCVRRQSCCVCRASGALSSMWWVSPASTTCLTSSSPTFQKLFASPQRGTEVFGFVTTGGELLNALIMFCAPAIVNRIGAKNALLTAGMIMSVRILGSSFASSAVEVVILKMLHMFEIPFLLVGTFKYISSAFNPRLSATLFLIGFNLSKQLSGVVLSAVGRMYDTVGFHQAYLILGCITLSFTLLSFVTLRGGNRLLPTAETQSPA
ncbi:Lactose permease [Klebsiella pneumoniae]|nr:Lactose permease [Klebsiella pneumoniae]